MTRSLSPPSGSAYDGEDRAVSRRRTALCSGGPRITCTEITSQASGASCVITTDSEGRRIARQSSHV
ncbi:MAG: hypothetical protein ACKO22_02030, partial [Cyanobium sp.]